MSVGSGQERIAEFRPIIAPSIERRDGSGEFLILCDHASSALPQEFGDLGLPEEVIESHAGWDIGALGCARSLSQITDSPLIFPAVSRLVIDCNRHVDHPELIVESTEFGSVPRNVHVSPDDRRERIRRVHQPFHREIEDLVRTRTRSGQLRAVVSLHSFTPCHAGVSRPWHVGILYRSCEAWAHSIRAHFEKVSDGNIGLNVPYSALSDGVFYSLDRHAESQSIPCLMIELRNDLLCYGAGQGEWADRIAEALRLPPSFQFETNASVRRDNV